MRIWMAFVVAMAWSAMLQAADPKPSVAGAATIMPSKQPDPDISLQDLTDLFLLGHAGNKVINTRFMLGIPFDRALLFWPDFRVDSDGCGPR